MHPIGVLPDISGMWQSRGECSMCAPQRIAADRRLQIKVNKHGSHENDIIKIQDFFSTYFTTFLLVK